MSNRAMYASSNAGQLENFFDSAYGAGVGNDGRLEKSARAGAVATCLDSAANTGGFALPPEVGKVIDGLKDQNDAGLVLDSVLVGMDAYKKQHGSLPTADVMEFALHQGYAATKDHLDGVGSTVHSDVFSAQPNRVVVAITAALAEAIPFAMYMPADIQSNQSRLAIVSHVAGSDFGAYANGALMDGVNIGGNYLASERRVALTPNGDRTQFTGAVTTRDGGAGDTVGLLRGRSIISVDGFPSAREVDNSTTANSPISGVATINGADYAISGHVAVATGVFQINVAPALPAGVEVHADGYIDFERYPDLAPELNTEVMTYDLYASPFRALARQSIDSRTQYAAELGLDLASESTLAIRNQFAMERHRAAIRKMLTVAKATTSEFNFDYSTQIAQKSRGQIWQDLLTPLGEVDQKMAENTMDHGVTHLYVTKTVAAQLRSLDRSLFEPSGLAAIPGIYRLGRLFGRFEVYYTPWELSESGDGATAQILAIGRSMQVARCPMVLGDAVPPTLLPLGRGGDLKEGVGFYARNFTQVNPHKPSAMGAALITVTGMK